MILRRACVLLVGALLCACATLPPGTDYPRTASSALAHPERTKLGRQLEPAAKAHQGLSGFRLLARGVDGFLARVQMVDAAERSLDLQYYIFRADTSGKLLADAVMRAADRNVRVRVLVDDADRVDDDAQIAALDAHPGIEVRIFNPFFYRGHARLFRNMEFLLSAARLDYRMHNKLLVADNAIALVGGRNIGDQYFQIDPESQFGDDDVFAAGPVVKDLSATFDEYWNSPLAVPAGALSEPASEKILDAYRNALKRHREQVKDVDFARRIATGEPLAGMLSGRLSLVWARAQVVCDAPDKRNLAGENGMLGLLMQRPAADAARAVRSELVMVTPFFIPGRDGMQLLADMRERGVRIRVLTNSLEATPEPAAHSGYMHYREALLATGVELYEARSLPGNARRDDEDERFGSYALHGKLFVFDRRRLFVGSMNFDQRSMRLNTEVGLMIDSPELARQAEARFEQMVQDGNSYKLALRTGSDGYPQIVWRTREEGRTIEYDVEPARNDWQRAKAYLLSLLPLDGEL